VGEIYGLFSGRDGNVRYVGLTVGSHAARFKQHQRFYTGLPRVRAWMRGEWRAGYPVRSALLEQCNNNEALNDAETKWIGKFPNLLNERKRTYHLRPYKLKPPVIPEIKEYRARFIFNYGGFRGIHWWRELDRFSVFVYSGGERWHWLPGDGAPGWTGEIWFSDFAEALKAREEFRERLKRYVKLDFWLPDKEEAAL
jgi:hypothetical protein